MHHQLLVNLTKQNMERGDKDERRTEKREHEESNQQRETQQHQSYLEKNLSFVGCSYERYEPLV